MNVKQVIEKLQAMIDTGAITGKEEFGVYIKYLPEEKRYAYFHSPEELKKMIITLYLSKSFIFHCSL